MSKNKARFKHDKYIIDELTKLNFPLKNFEGKLIFPRPDSKREKGVEHIAKFMHGLQVRDIEDIPKVLMSPYKVHIDPNYSYRRNYYAYRRGKHKSDIFLKIVTNICEKNNTEYITTIYPTSKIKC